VGTGIAMDVDVDIILNDNVPAWKDLVNISFKSQNVRSMNMSNFGDATKKNSFLL